MEMTAENLANDTRQRASEQWYVGKSLTTGSPGKESISNDRMKKKKKDF